MSDFEEIKAKFSENRQRFYKKVEKNLEINLPSAQPFCPSDGMEDKGINNSAFGCCIYINCNAWDVPYFKSKSPGYPGRLP